MKILLANKYFYKKGGAEESFFQTAELLKNKGHKTIYFSMHHPRNFASDYGKYFISNIDYEKKGLLNSIRVSSKLLYSFEAKANMKKLIKEEKPDLAHLNNIYHQISPSIIHALNKFHIPIVMSLRDFKMTCASYSLIKDGEICDICAYGKFYRCFLKGCVKNSRMKSILSTIEMYLHHKIMHIYDQVDLFISPSRFLKQKLEDMGFKGKIIHLPNFLILDGYRPQFHWEDNSIVYFGRLIKEKGLFTLLKAMERLDIGLKIIGEGPIEEELKRKAKALSNKKISFLGYLSGEKLKNEIKKSMFVVLPSELYENNPRTIIEGFALGKPAIGTEWGGIPELIKNGQTGLTYRPGNSDELRTKINYLIKNENLIKELGRKARLWVEEELNEEKHYKKLIKIYESARHKRFTN